MVDSFWDGKRIAVTGATGFLGSHVIDRLVATRRVPAQSIVAIGHGDVDLRVGDQALAALRTCDVLLHVAGDVGGAGYSYAHPATQLYNNTVMDLQVLEAARRCGVARVLLVGCVVGYSPASSVPLTETRVLEGPVPESSSGISQAKRTALVASALYHREFGLNVSVVMPANAYGPRDELDLARAHVIPATIIKCLTSDEVVALGDPATSRDFVFVEDAAEGILLAAELLPPGECVNIGSGVQTSIGEMVERCVALTGFKGTVRFDGAGPSTPSRRPLDLARARQLLGYVPRHSLDSGLTRTIAWYRAALASGTRV